MRARVLSGDTAPPLEPTGTLEERRSVLSSHADMLARGQVSELVEEFIPTGDELLDCIGGSSPRTGTVPPASVVRTREVLQRSLPALLASDDQDRRVQVASRSTELDAPLRRSRGPENPLMTLANGTRRAPRGAVQRYPYHQASDVPCDARE